MNDFDYLAQLPGQEREQTWIRERLETLSVREGIILAAAAMHTAPETAVDAINCLQSLNDYKVRVGVGSYEALGRAYLRNETKMPERAQRFADLTQTGKYYEDRNPGLFVGNCYVEYPKDTPWPVYRSPDTLLPEDNGWSVRLKIASPAVPEGVWLRLPSPSNWDDESLQDETLALQELRVQNLEDCTLLDAQCILPEAGNLMKQYDSIGDLIYDGQELGCILGKHGQGSLNFMERFAAALELEDCRNLKLALDISRNLNCYDWISCAKLEELGKTSLVNAGVSEKLIRSCGIDLSAYQAQQLEDQGYTLTADESAYVARNTQAFQHQYSEPMSQGTPPTISMGLG